MKRPVLQVALDLIELPRALAIGDEAVRGGADWVEAGTPLIKSEGMEAVRALREQFPDLGVVADMKVADAGAIEVEMAARAGASVVCVLADADDTVIEEAVRTASVFGVDLMADLLNVQDPLGRAQELEVLGVQIINAHVGIDQQMIGRNSLDLLENLRGLVGVRLAVAGGLGPATAAQAVEMGADIVIIGSFVTRSAKPMESVRKVREALDHPSKRPAPATSPSASIREILAIVSTPNISDAMHRKGAMSGITPRSGKVKMAGPAVTVRSLAGDWAKPVEAVDVAEPGDVLVIDNEGSTVVATWGELATLSAKGRGLSGVVIDGSVRDVDDLRDLSFPVYARAVVPCAGEPKGFGEVNCEISCGGQQVRPGDWIAADESGLVVIPRERALEIARRALEVRKSEERMREEIRRGSTLSQVSGLVKWEKK
jgi:3-hexulose-6-phosphate synthase/6-phospho-3-hexuloisomerase